jgi:2-methylisocitrate lyase-like PEP mutase family enzyme
MAVHTRGPRLNQREKAEAFRKLHAGEKILILPNAWDVPSARVFEEAGFPAVATTSAGLSVSLGYPDGEKVSKEEMFVVVRKIANSLSVPLSVDIESGFGSSLTELQDTVKQVVLAGGIGVNLEDIQNFELKTIESIEKQVRRIKEVRNTANSMGVALVINARTDAYRLGEGEETQKIEEAILRANAYGDAGADCTYPIGITDAYSIRSVVNRVKYPVNVMVRPGLPPVSELQKIGVARLSIGPYGIYAAIGLLKRAAAELLNKGTYNAFAEGAINLAELNSLAAPRSTAAGEKA